MAISLLFFCFTVLSTIDAHNRRCMRTFTVCFFFRYQQILTQNCCSAYSVWLRTHVFYLDRLGFLFSLKRPDDTFLAFRSFSAQVQTRIVPFDVWFVRDNGRFHHRFEPISTLTVYCSKKKFVCARFFFLFCLCSMSSSWAWALLFYFNVTRDDIEASEKTHTHKWTQWTRTENSHGERSIEQRRQHAFSACGICRW